MANKRSGTPSRLYVYDPVDLTIVNTNTKTNWMMDVLQPNNLGPSKRMKGKVVGMLTTTAGLNLLPTISLELSLGALVVPILNMQSLIANGNVNFIFYYEIANEGDPKIQVIHWTLSGFTQTPITGMASGTVDTTLGQIFRIASTYSSLATNTTITIKDRYYEIN